MPENDPGTPAPDPKEGHEFMPITSQDALDKMITERVRRERAKYADYADLKTKASKLDEIEAANKTEADRAAERLAALETELAATRTTALRARVQARHGIADEDAELFLTGSDEETLTRQAERLAARDTADRSRGNHVAHEGKTPDVTPGNEPLRKMARQLFGPAQT